MQMQVVILLLEGAWTLYAQPSFSGRALAENIQRFLGPIANSSPNRFYADGTSWTGGRTLHVLRRTSMPAVIIEIGFTTNTNEAMLLSGENYLEHLAVAIMKGVVELGKVVYDRSRRSYSE